MSGSQSQQERMHDAQSQEMMIDPELLALDARAAEESAKSMSLTDDTKLEALEILLPGISQYLAHRDGAQSYSSSAVPEQKPQPGSAAQPDTQFGNQVMPVAQSTAQYESNASGQEEHIHFEMDNSEAKDTGRSEYLAWLSRQ